MPFLKLASNHRCVQPTTRPDGTPVKLGDIWQCDVTISAGVPCGAIYRYENDQRDGNYWARYNGTVR
jgi:hypothetical protein